MSAFRAVQSDAVLNLIARVLHDVVIGGAVDPITIGAVIDRDSEGVQAAGL